MNRLSRDKDLGKRLFLELVKCIEKYELLERARFKSRSLARKKQGTISIGYDDTCHGSCFTISGIDQYFASKGSYCDIDNLEEKAGLRDFEKCRRHIQNEVHVYDVSGGVKILNFICENNEQIWDEIYGIYPNLRQPFVESVPLSPG